MEIRAYLQKQKILTDGSFGTYYAEKYQTQEIPELANINHKERVKEIHKEYIEAGAKLIRTNTFASNTFFLETGLEQVKENIRAAVQIAKEAIAECSAENRAESNTEDIAFSKKEVFLAGDIGPITSESLTDEERIEDEYDQIVETFLTAGVKIITFETFSDMKNLKKAMVRANKAGAFVMMQFSINQFGYSNAGLRAGKLLEEAANCKEADAIGFNCGVGPGHMKQILSRITLPADKFLITLPNAGYPKRIRNRFQFDSNPEYFSQKMEELSALKVDILGGCCGTTPKYILKLKETLSFSAEKRCEKTEKENETEKTVKKSAFYCDEKGNEKTGKLIAVELAPPVDTNDEKVMEAAHYLSDMGVDVLTFPDSPSGRTRVDSVLMAEKVRRETGLVVMPHICCRDKNAIAMRSLFLGAHINQIDNMLIVTGDPVPTMIRQTVKPVFHFDSVGLMKIVKDMNEEIFKDRPLTVGGAINQGRRNLEVEIKRVKMKMEAGATFFMTQPIFSKEDADRVKRIKEETGARILCGIMPLISRKNALFMKNEIAGIPVTDEIVARYPEKATKAEGEAVGVAIAREIMEYTKEFADGYYFSFPFNRVYLLEQIMDER